MTFHAPTAVSSKRIGRPCGCGVYSWNSRYDLFACLKCDVWVEKKDPCSDPECEFCVPPAPEKPSDVK